MSEKDMKTLIKNHYEQFSAKEKLVADYVLQNYQHSMMLSSCELAEAAGVSDTTVVRFAKTLGFSGFLQYRNQIKKEYVPTQKVYASLSSLEEERTDSDGLLNWYFQGLHRSFETLFQQMPTDTIDAMAKSLKQSDTVYLFGIGSDSVIAKFMQNYLALMGIKCVCVTEEGLSMKEKLFLMGEHDCLFMSAYPTLEDSDYWVCDFAKERKAKILMITDSDLAAHKLHADVSICVKEDRETFFNSCVLQMAVCNAILIRIYELYTESVTSSMKEYQDMMLFSVKKTEK